MPVQLPVVRNVSEQNNKQNLQTETPPDNFRKMEIMPSKSDLFEKPNFLRPNVIKGGYQNVEHYLDVQFRLMREDFVSPLRDAITEYMEDETKLKRRYGSANFYRNVKILNYCETKNGVGIKICYDERILKDHLKKQGDNTKNERSPRKFLYQSLLLLVKNNFDDFVFCTIEDSIAPHGIITAIIDPRDYSKDLFRGTYLMIQSDVYFPPYLHILEMLKRSAAIKSFPFYKYLIQAEVSPKPPSYLPIKDYKLINNHVVQNGKWPNHEQLGLHKSQYDAYVMALTREFVTIQGPPGTGKTFVALKVAETLLQNLYLNNKHRDRSPILVVCYTNRTLDKFLEGLLPFTKSIVRVGGQSKSIALKKYNLNKKRAKPSKAFKKHRDLLKDISASLRHSLHILNIVNSSMEVYDLTQDIQGVNFKKFFEKFNRDEGSIPPLLYWLTMSDKISNGNFDDNLLLCSDNNNTEEEHTSEEVEYEDNDGVVDIDDLHRLEFDLGDSILADIHLGKRTKVPSFNVQRFEKKTLETEKKLTENYDPSYESERQKCALHLRMIKVFKERMKRGNIRYPTDVRVTKDNRGEDYSMEQRWALYWKWQKQVKEKYTQTLITDMQKFNHQKAICDELRSGTHLKCLKAAHVVGVTTSGAARLHSLLRSLKSPILIVEDAAKVMETHLLVSLTNSCQHIIMIGDHQQLRPITGSNLLATDYNLDISLFERMVKNGSQCLQLSVQHRMRPEISKLITPAIYPELQDHPSVHDFPHILGVRKNLFFLDHTVHEDKIVHSTSRLNIHEAHFALNLAKYFVQQGYDPADITILATYSDQMFYMRRECNKIPIIKKVLVVGLDNYQGEENKIIILSLVRSNEEGNIGFLSTANRVCVALSRAKHGFYMIGNMSNLRVKSPLWRQVLEVLESREAFGDNLELQCQIHRDVITPVASAEDFGQVANGGCGQRDCNSLLKCGHRCTKKCHVLDMEHKGFLCQEKCDRIICDLGHKCQDLCFKECKCMTVVTRTFPCGHKNRLPCSTDYKTAKCDLC